MQAIDESTISPSFSRLVIGLSSGTFAILQSRQSGLSVAVKVGGSRLHGSQLPCLFSRPLIVFRSIVALSMRTRRTPARTLFSAILIGMSVATVVPVSV